MILLQFGRLAGYEDVDDGDRLATRSRHALLGARKLAQRADPRDIAVKAAGHLGNVGYDSINRL